MDINKITKEQFDTAYNKFPPNGWTKFIFKYFSKSTEKKNMVVSSTLGWILGGLFAAGFIETVLNLPHALILVSVLLYSGILVVLAIGMFGALIMNNLRINKIAKTLGVTIEEYNSLVSKYYS
jgi:hypothetical protein